ncbi:cytidylyltransferase domain-containing protein [Peribacillus sp. NPDC097264]|uniref:cytidylyltransferase domain-containing protein n=1 Tax=Peribacillus sp. NPDC097264 TaxID=3390616 RepID=UPI003CFE4BCA
MKVVAVIQARMGSTRLPGKVMRKVQGKPLLEYQVERVKQSKFINKIVVATTIKESDQPIVDLFERLSVAYFRGSEDDVLSRFFEAATKHHAKIVIRLTADCPLNDHHKVDKVLAEYFLNAEEYDYASNTLERTYPRGFDVEVFSMETLEKAYKEANGSAYREHVTPYIYYHPELFNLASIHYHTDLSSFRLTVDTEDDLVLITKLLHHLQKKEDFTLEDIMGLLQEHPDWASLNSHIEQLKVSMIKIGNTETDDQ